ncbi:MAG: hypothetical protein FWF76_06450, partial [Oscillospiraceae bacterium]|nr:hypothetical protein [Oscillospiraceae bacterium]
MKDLIIIGGDLRFVYAANKLKKSNPNFSCAIYGFDLLHEDVQSEAHEVDFIKKIEPAKNVILPLPMSRNCDYITAPYHSGRISIPDVIANACTYDTTVFCGKACPELQELCERDSLTLCDYFEREELTVVNAGITAEGALEIIMREKAKAVLGMKILITGYGRISKILARHLHTLGANVTIAARKHADLAWAKVNGCRAVKFGDEFDSVLENFDTIVNTVPAQILTRKRLLKLREDCLIVDLASKTGVEGMELSKSGSVSVAGVKVIWALSLPGK